jgi:hypothetical protein
MHSYGFLRTFHPARCDTQHVIDSALYCSVYSDTRGFFSICAVIENPIYPSQIRRSTSLMQSDKQGINRRMDHFDVRVN